MGIRLWTRWLTIGHLALLGVAAMYLLMVVGNSVAFGYNFWVEVAPSDRADNVALVSIGVFLVLAGSVGAIAYGWMCVNALEATSGRRIGLWDSLGFAVGPALRASPYGIPALTLAAVGTFSLVGSILLGPLASLPLVVLDGVRKPIRRWSRFVESSRPHHAIIGFGVGTSSLPMSAAVVFTIWLVSQHDGWVQAVAVLPLWIGFVILVVGTGCAATALAYAYRLYRGQVRRLRGRYPVG